MGIEERDRKHEGDRESCRRRWKNILHLLIGPAVLDIGCAHGDGCTFLPPSWTYKGIDWNFEQLSFPETRWKEFARVGNRSFHLDDFRTFLASRGPEWDTIVCLETLEHVEDGVEWATRLPQYARSRVILSVPRGEQSDSNGHVLHNLQPEQFPGYRLEGGSMILVWDNPECQH